MSARRRISQGVQNAVRERAAGYCEYCHTAEKWQYVRFTIDHIVSVAQGGADNIDNLALACFTVIAVSRIIRQESILKLGCPASSFTLAK